MKEYLDCKCGSKETYIGFSEDVCCYLCFKPLTEKIIEQVDMTAGVFADDNGWAVNVNGVTKKYFSKHEDYALNEATIYAEKLNFGLVT